MPGVGYKRRCALNLFNLHNLWVISAFSAWSAVAPCDAVRVECRVKEMLWPWCDAVAAV